LYNEVMLASLTRPIVFAHRGASARAPENTLAAFKLAEAEGAKAIELDAKLSADGEVVVFHDNTLERTTNGSGRVGDHCWSELRALDAGSSFSDAFRGEKIPLLSEVFEVFGGRIFINVELKDSPTHRDDLARKVCELVEKHSLQEGVTFSSFFPSNLQQAARLLPEVPRGLVAQPGWKGAWARSFGFSFGDFAALHPHFSDASRQQIQRVHRLKRRIHVWTVNEIEEMRRLVESGVDGFFTQDPKLALDVVGGRV
jgi:glycerophosphoryl diester phosphodiesterase